jgi:hypothetical protein
MTAALEILLKGKVFDGGAASFSGSAPLQRQMLELARRCPAKTPLDRAFVQYRLAQLTDGCVASSDQPGCYFVAELLQLYPDAKVIVTMRDRDSWWASYSALWEGICDLQAHSWLFPQTRRFCEFSFRFWDRVPQVLGLKQCEPWPMENQEGLYEAHAAYIRRVVPEGQLFYFDVKSGWAPLCDILGVKEVPQGAFPHVFPREWLKRGKADQRQRMKKRLLLVGGGVGVVVGAAVYAVRRYLARPG